VKLHALRERLELRRGVAHEREEVHVVRVVVDRDDAVGEKERGVRRRRRARRRVTAALGSEGRSIRSDVGVEFKGVRSGVERRRGRGL